VREHFFCHPGLDPGSREDGFPIKTFPPKADIRE